MSMLSEARAKILIIEDDIDLQSVLRRRLESEGFLVSCASDGSDGLRRAAAECFGLVILDINLPSMSGLEVCRAVRCNREDQAILILSSRSAELDRVSGFDVGADDYVVKPFSMDELIGRIRAILRRFPREADESATLSFAELTIDLFRRRALFRGNDLELTAVEFDLLETLARSPGKPFSRLELMELVWGFQASAFDPTVTTHICRLRSKLEDSSGPSRFIKTVRGIGYRFAEIKEL